MSWDIWVAAAKETPPPIASMSKDWSGDVLGSAAEVRQKISRALPGTDWGDPAWGRFAGDGFSFEFNLGDEDPKQSFMIHVRGGGDSVRTLLEFAERCGWYLLDCSEGEWLHHGDELQSGWQQFQAYRDSVLRQSPPAGEGSDR